MSNSSPPRYFILVAVVAVLVSALVIWRLVGSDTEPVSDATPDTAIDDEPVEQPTPETSRTESVTDSGDMDAAVTDAATVTPIGEEGDLGVRNDDAATADADVVTDRKQAAALFMAAEAMLQKLPDVSKIDKSEEDFKEEFFKAMAGYERVRREFQKVVETGDPVWSVAAHERMGYCFEQFANLIRSSPLPNELTPEQTETYLASIESKATQILGGAKSQYRLCVAVAEANDVTTERSKTCDERLIALAEVPDSNAPAAPSE